MVKPSCVADTMQVMLLQSGGEELEHVISLVPRTEVERAMRGMMSQVVMNELLFVTTTVGRVEEEEVEQAVVRSGIMVLGTSSTNPGWLKVIKFIFLSIRSGEKEKEKCTKKKKRIF